MRRFDQYDQALSVLSQAGGQDLENEFVMTRHLPCECLPSSEDCRNGEAERRRSLLFHYRVNWEDAHTVMDAPAHGLVKKRERLGKLEAFPLNTLPEKSCCARFGQSVSSNPEGCYSHWS